MPLRTRALAKGVELSNAMSYRTTSTYRANSRDGTPPTLEDLSLAEASNARLGNPPISLPQTESPVDRTTKIALNQNTVSYTNPVWTPETTTTLNIITEPKKSSLFQETPVFPPKPTLLIALPILEEPALFCACCKTYARSCLHRTVNFT